MKITLPEGGNLEQLSLVEHVALTLMAQHGLNPGQPGGWRFVWGRGKNLAGWCDYDKRILRFSAPLHSLWTIEQSTDNILHEIAHALAGPGHHHDDVWRKIAKDIGATGSRCWGGLGEKRHPYTWVGICPNGHKRYAYRKPKKNYCCSTCSPHVWDRRYVRRWEKIA